MNRAYLGKLDEVKADYAEHIRQGLQYTGIATGGLSGKRVFLKPNLTFPNYEPGVMTSPEAVEAAIVVLKDLGAEIWTGDSDSGGYNPFPMEEVYEATGINGFAKRFGVHVVNLSQLPRKTVTCRKGTRNIEVELPRLLTDDIDLFITMPVPKIHMNTGVSLTFKNQWGCIPEPQDRLKLHPYFPEVVAAVNEAVHARAAIIDGRFGLNGSGPMRGDPIRLNWLCVVNNLGAGERMMCELMQVPLRNIAHLRYAERRGLIPELAEIEVNEDLANFKGPRFYLKRKWTDWPGYLAFHNRTLAHIAYFSRLADPLHRLLYRFREPFYDYDKARRGQEPNTTDRPGDEG